MRHVRVGQVRLWRVGPRDSPEAWKKTNSGWKQLKESATGEAHECGLNEVRDDQQMIWHTFLDSLFDGNKSVSENLLDSWLRHVSSFGYHTPVQEVAHALRVASVRPEVVPGHEILYSMYGHIDPWDGHDLKSLAAKIIKKRAANRE